ncbi:hypothetical protein D3C85_1063350 [compost metagenome]
MYRHKLLALSEQLCDADVGYRSRFFRHLQRKFTVNQERVYRKQDDAKQPNIDSILVQ